MIPAPLTPEMASITGRGEERMALASTSGRRARMEAVG